MDLITLITTYGVSAVAVLAFVVSVITEVIKDIKVLKDIPTSLVVIVLSLIVTVVAYLGAISYFNATIIWYELVMVIFASFIVALVAKSGWENVADIWKRFNK